MHHAGFMKYPQEINYKKSYIYKFLIFYFVYIVAGTTTVAPTTTIAGTTTVAGTTTIAGTTTVAGTRPLMEHPPIIFFLLSCVRFLPSCAVCSLLRDSLGSHKLQQKMAVVPASEANLKAFVAEVLARCKEQTTSVAYKYRRRASGFGKAASWQQVQGTVRNSDQDDHEIFIVGCPAKEAGKVDLFEFPHPGYEYADIEVEEPTERQKPRKQRERSNSEVRNQNISQESEAKEHHHERQNQKKQTAQAVQELLDEIDMSDEEDPKQTTGKPTAADVTLSMALDINEWGVTLRSETQLIEARDLILERY